MENYQIKLSCKGDVTQLPDSQKIFGTLITMMAQTLGDEKATQFVQAVFQKRIHLALSNVMPWEYLPMPEDFMTDQLSKSKFKANDLKEMRKNIKERAFITLNDLKFVWNQPQSCDKIKDYVCLTDDWQLRIAMDSVLYGMEGLETRMYTVPVQKLIYSAKKNSSSISEQGFSEFYFYLQMESDDLGQQLLNLIDQCIKDESPWIMGKRSSQGLNKYYAVSMQWQRLPRADVYLNLGMLLPEKIDYQASTLKLFTSERRPFSMPGGWRKDDEKYFISFIAPGSIIHLQEGVKQAGGCVPSPFNSRDIVFGNAFLYPLTFGKEEHSWRK